MSEREPDPLFDALRDRLGGHERPPAPATWAALAGQLAAARRRRRRRWWLAGGTAALLGLLVVLLGRGPRPVEWFLTGGRGTQSLVAGATSSTGHILVENTDATVKNTKRSLRKAEASVEDKVKSVTDTDASVKNIGTLMNNTDASVNNTEASVKTAEALAIATDSSTKTTKSLATSGHQPLAVRGEVPVGNGSRALDTIRRAVAVAVTGRPRNRRQRKMVEKEMRAVVRELPVAPAHPLLRKHVAGAQPLVVPLAAGSAIQPKAAGWALLTPRDIAVQLDSATPARPVPAVVADSAHPVPPTVGPRWSIGLGLGFDLTHRQLTGADVGPLERIERAAGAGQAAISAGYALTPRLHVRAGVGYAVYRQAIRANIIRAGTTLAYVEQTITGPDGHPIRTLSWQWVPTDSVLGRQTARAQPTARYLTVPLLAEWHPRAPAPRWRPVLAAGLVPHVLLSARTATLTSGCDCETAPADQRRFALGLTAAAGFDYALRSDLWLTLRPAATYLLTNTASPGQPTRHPWRVGLTVGLSWNPAPRAAPR